MLVRFVDDYLYITTDAKRARAFVDTMHRGPCRFRACHVQDTLSCDTDTNEPCDLSSQDLPSMAAQ